MFTQIGEYDDTPTDIFKEAGIMTIGGIKENDIVYVDIRGQKFYAMVTGTIDNPEGSGKVLTIAPINANVTYFRAKPRQVIAHWSKRKS